MWLFYKVTCDIFSVQTHFQYIVLSSRHVKNTEEVRTQENMYGSDCMFCFIDWNVTLCLQIAAAVKSTLCFWTISKICLRALLAVFPDIKKLFCC